MLMMLMVLMVVFVVVMFVMVVFVMVVPLWEFRHFRYGQWFHGHFFSHDGSLLWFNVHIDTVSYEFLLALVPDRSAHLPVDPFFPSFPWVIQSIAI
ncbi:hypothetical protein C8J48_2857 [Desmospora activa DSM 45169]|uniref:Uncharacterized protein n=1 Tax=Desmospora activa DSM 45169 TaxID=1121389 RepID=A0A2T4Z3T3_9BACL|nr:hypothetical protein C8J48_2857 [Desmospora activa DSM 45169]